MKNYTAAFAAGVALVLSTSAHSESWFAFEAGIGGAAYQSGPDGRWFQDGFAHKLTLTAPAFEVGVTGNIYQGAKWGVDWHLDWAWLGTIHTDAYAVPDDANYNLATKKCNGPCMPLARYRGSGHDMGFMATIEPHYDVGGWRFGVEAGPYLHRNTWSESVTGWTAPGDPNNPTGFYVDNNPKWIWGAVVGASVGYKNFSLAYQYFLNKAHTSDPTPPVWNGTHALMAKYKANIF